MSVHPRPDVAAADAWAFPAQRSHHLDNGLRVITLDLPGQHVVSLRLGIPLPLSAEPRDLEGMALLMARGLDEGTSRHTGEEFAELIESHGIALGAGVGERGLVIEIDVIGGHFAAAMDILAQCLTEAAYPDIEVARLKRARLSDIDHEHADPGSRAALAFAQQYFRDEDRASRPTGGTRQSVSALTAADLRDFAAATIAPRGATLCLAGDLASMPTEPVTVIEAALGSWTSAKSITTPAELGTRDDGALGLVFVDRPGSAQSHLYVGRPGATRRTPHGWGTFSVLAFLLGGSPQARIDAVLREEHGYTYGMRAGFSPRGAEGLCSISGAVRAEATSDALAALMQVLSFTGADLTEEEVRHGGDFVAKTAPGRYSTADGIANEVTRLALDGFDSDFVTATLATARSVSRQGAADAWNGIRSGPGWTTVVVGDAAAHADAVGGLGLGEVSVIPA